MGDCDEQPLEVLCVDESARRLVLGFRLRGSACKFEFDTWFAGGVWYWGICRLTAAGLFFSMAKRSG